MWWLIPMILWWYTSPLPAFHLDLRTEICDNAIDDDGDGRIDLNDPECLCSEAGPTSLIPNPSFEDRECCPWGRSQMHCASTWIQASAATTDYINTCNYLGWEDLPIPLPIPDGDGCVGFRDGRFRTERLPNWKEYAGACLISPLKADEAYKIRFYVGFTHADNSPPLEITFFGTPDCKYLPFGVEDIATGCPTNTEGWIKLGATSVSGANTWRQTDINIVPEMDIKAIAIGPACAQRDASVDLYYFLDDLVLDRFDAFDFAITEENNPCSGAFSISVPAYANVRYQWYRNGIALIGETQARLMVGKDEGIYQLRIIDESGDCRLTKPYLHQRQVYTYRKQVYMCPGESYQFGNDYLGKSGNYVKTFPNQEGCDSVVQLDFRILSESYDTISAKVFRGEAYRLGNNRYRFPGTYEIRFTSSRGCDSLVLLNLEYFRVYQPTAFSPNGDQINDRFTIFGEEDITAIQSLQIFDRWGGEIFHGKSLEPGNLDQGWDGTENGNPVPPGLYVYSAILIMNDQKERQISGSVMLAR